jgi:glycosyltransferase involved in cell wall biosynthesis
VRILHISSAKTFGGGERHLVDLCRELVHRGHDVFIALRPTNEWQARLDFIPPENFLYVSIRNSFGMFSAKQIGRFLINNKIDVIHAHVARDYLAASVASRIAKESRFVLTRHVVFPMKPFHKIALGNIDAAIAVSGGVARQLERIFPESKIAIVPNGLTPPAGTAARSDLGRGFRDDHGISPDAPLVGTVGELRPLKGQRDFLLAAAEIVKDRPESRFVIAGADTTVDKRHRRELRRLASVLRLDDHIVWLDWLDDLTPLLASLDIFVSPSHSESFGLATLEAMMNECCVVATDTDGARELVGETGRIVPVGAPLAIASAVRGLLADPASAKRMAAMLKAKAMERFSLERMVDGTEAIYNRVVSQSSR